MSCLTPFTLILLFLSANLIRAQSQDSLRVELDYGKRGFEVRTSDRNYTIQIQPRFQFRYATPFDDDPSSYEELGAPSTQYLGIRRARLKIGGNAYKPYLKYYFESDLIRGRLLDFRVMIEKWDYFKIKVGQWKVEYNRERVISSGKQGLVDRSLINTYFTLDRQQGVTVYGNFGNSGLANFSYWAAILMGSGRNINVNPTNDLMYNAKLQWNFCGKKMVMESSDIRIRKKGIGSVAFAAASYKGPYTLFSSSGGSTYFDVPDTISPYYDVKQINFETAFMKQGFSWQSEIHLKNIESANTRIDQNFAGAYLQSGYFFHQVLPQFPENLEMVARYAVFTPDFDKMNKIQEEYSVGVNYFFSGHRNKLTAEVTKFQFDDPVFGLADRYRFRMQWDISF